MKIQIEIERPRWLQLPRTWRMRTLATLAAAGAVAVPAGWATHVFSDVPAASPHHADVGALRGAGITAGCNPPSNTLYCPADAVRRDQMASFLQRGLGRVTRSFGSGSTVGSGPLLGPVVTLGSVTISVPGVTGTQFVYVAGEVGLYTNDTKAIACPVAATAVCNLYLYLFDGADDLAMRFVRLSSDQWGTVLGVSAVAAVPAGSTKTYTLKIQSFNVGVGRVFLDTPHLTAATFPFGGSGGSTIGEAPPAPSQAALDARIAKSR